MSILPSNTPGYEVSVSHDHSPLSEDENRDPETCEIAKINEIFNMTEEVMQEETELRNHKNEQKIAEEEEMRRRREALKKRVERFRQEHMQNNQERRKGMNEPTLEDNVINTSSIQITPKEGTSSFGCGSDVKINKKWASIPWTTRLWHSTYNTFRYIIVAVSYMPGIDPNEANAPSEYYQREEYD